MQCALNHYRRGRECVKCVEGQQRHIMIGVFVVSFNYLLFHAHLDVINVIMVVIETLQTFRAIGMMGAGP